MSMTGGERTDLPRPGGGSAGASPAVSKESASPAAQKGGTPVRVVLGSTRFIFVIFWLTVFIGALVFVLPRYQDNTDSPFFLIFAGLSIVLFLANYFFPFEGYHPALFVLMMLATDALIAVLVYLTGGSQSNLFLLYMAVIIFSAAYLDLLYTVFIAAATSFVYFTPVLYEEVAAETFKTMTFTVPIFIILTICGHLLIGKARQHASEKDVVTDLLKQADLKRQELSTLYSSSLKLATTLDHREIGDTLIDYAAGLLQAEAAFLLVDVDGPPGELVSAYGIGEREVKGLLASPGDNPVLLAGEAVLPVILNSGDLDPRFRPFAAAHPQVGSLLSVPLFASTRVIGIICCLSPTDGAFGDDSARLLLTLASQAAVAVDKSMLYRSTLEDKLRIEAIINGLDDGIIFIDGQALLVLANPSTQRFLGISADDFGLPIATVLERLRHPWRLKENSLADFLQRVTVHGEMVQDDMVVGEPAPLRFQLSGIPLKDQEGNNAGSILLLHDITELARLDELKSDFISIVSHELRTPLTSIRGFARLMNAERVGPVTEKQRHYLDIVESQAEGLTNLVNDLLDLSKIESGVMEVSLKPLLLQDLLESVIQHLQNISAERGITVVNRLPADLEPVDGDRERLNQVFFNLIGNSLKFTGPGGTVTISAEREDGHCLLSVADTGIGIPPADLDRIFDKFYQVDSSLTRQRGGTGLGLAISRQLITAHGGEIWAASREGEGTTFFVKLRFSEG